MVISLLLIDHPAAKNTMSQPGATQDAVFNSRQTVTEVSVPA
jgi:hypothetical protein